jgi:hypothetical protein
MKTKVVLLVMWCGAGLSLQAQVGSGAAGAEVRTQQIAAERNALVEMLNEPNTPQEKKAFIQQLLEWNTRGVTIGEFKQMQAQRTSEPAQQAPAVVVGSPPPAQNLAEAEAAPLLANVAVGGGSMLHSFSKGRDAESSARAAASLGLVKTQQELEGVTRESEAKAREAQQIRNAAGATALAQRQQDAASMASQQAAGGFGAVLGDSLMQSVQQGAQAAGQAIGGGAVGRMGGALGSSASGGGAVTGGGGGVGDAVGGAAAAGASAAAGQIFGGGAPAVEPAMGSGQPATVGADGGGVAVDENATMAIGARLSPRKYEKIGAEHVYRADNVVMDTRKSLAQQVGRADIAVQQKRATDSVLAAQRGQIGRSVVQSEQHVNKAMDAKARKVWDNAANVQAWAEPARVSEKKMLVRPAVQGFFDAACPKHGRYGGEIGKVKGCPQCEREKNQMWDAFCKLHGKYGGRGPVTGCPKCAAENTRLFSAGYMR